MISTNCKDCIFANPVSSGNPCTMDLINTIKTFKTIEVKNDYNYIYDYQCKYGFSKAQYLENKTDLDKTDIVNTLKQKNLIQYYLVIDLELGEDIVSLCHHINNLSIRPQYVSILSYQDNNTQIINLIKKHIDVNIRWKIHNFLDYNIDHNVSLKVALDTSSILYSMSFLWINKSSYMSYIVESNAIANINHIVNIQQPKCNFIRSQKFLDDNLHNLLLSTSTYKHLIKNVSSSLEEGIETLTNTTTVYYD